MILSNIRAYMREHRRVSIVDLSDRFDSQPEAVRGMLANWVSRGRVRQVELDQHCGGCTRCDTSKFEVYEWVVSPKTG